jgi:glycosyltransferase involved in cell wall biosynthesis
MYDAINKGIRMATGEVIGTLNADDFLFGDDVIEKIAREFLSPEKRDVVYTDIQFVRESKTLRYYSAKRWKPWMLQWGYMPPHPGVYIRRNAFERLGVYKLGYHIAADYELLIRFLRKGGVVAQYLNLCSVGMRMGGKSTKNWKSTLILNREIVRGNRENGYFCCMLMLIPKYLFKIWEFILPRFKPQTNTD